MQAVVAEIRVRDRGHIEPVFRVPIFGFFPRTWGHDATRLTAG